jgi:chromosome segregation ATPase
MPSQSLTLREAAERLGISVPALRMRWKRGKIKGRTVDGRVHINLPSQGLTEGSQEPSQPSEAISDWVMEKQSIELARVKAELDDAKRQISDERQRFDNLMQDVRRDRDSEAVLRNQLQQLLGRLEERIALPAPDSQRLEKLERENRQLKGGVVSLVDYVAKKVKRSGA